MPDLARQNKFFGQERRKFDGPLEIVLEQGLTYTKTFNEGLWRASID